MFTRLTTFILAVFMLTVTVAAQTQKRVRTAEARTAVTARKPPALTLELVEINHIAARLKRASTNTVCAGDRVVMRIRSADPSIKPSKVAWVATGGKIIGTGDEIIFDTTDLPPGEYHITSQAVYSGMGLCNGDCSAYDTKTVRVTECPPEIICFTSPVITVTPDVRTLKRAGECVDFVAAELTGGQGYGRVTYTWASSAGRLTSNGLTAKLCTEGVAPGTEIEVTVNALSEFAECKATGIARVLVPVPPPPVRELTPCETFKRSNARVDNACKFVLSDGVRAMQADPNARLYVDAYYTSGENGSIAAARGKNVRDRLADGSLGFTVDANRIVVRNGGMAADGKQVRIYVAPEGSEIHAGGAELNLGPVESEGKSDDDDLPAKPKRKPGQ